MELVPLKARAVVGKMSGTVVSKFCFLVGFIYSNFGSRAIDTNHRFIVNTMY